MTGRIDSGWLSQEPAIRKHCVATLRTFCQMTGGAFSGFDVELTVGKVAESCPAGVEEHGRVLVWSTRSNYQMLEARKR